jgi:hypothetical protein
MELLRKVASFGTNMEEKRNIYILLIRSILEQSCVVWHSSLTEEIEKGFVKNSEISCEDHPWKKF